MLRLTASVPYFEGVQMGIAGVFGFGDIEYSVDGIIRSEPLRVAVEEDNENITEKNRLVITFNRKELIFKLYYMYAKNCFPIIDISAYSNVYRFFMCYPNRHYPYVEAKILKRPLLPLEFIMYMTTIYSICDSGRPEKLNSGKLKTIRENQGDILMFIFRALCQFPLKKLKFNLCYRQYGSIKKQVELSDRKTVEYASNLQMRYIILPALSFSKFASHSLFDKSVLRDFYNKIHNNKINDNGKLYYSNVHVS